MPFPRAYCQRNNIFTLDMSHIYKGHSVIANGKNEYQGHPTTVLMPDRHTVFCVWTIGHGGYCGPMKKSLDGGKTWSGFLQVPDDWRNYVNCPTIWHLPSADTPERLAVYAQEPETREMFAAFSKDGGISWSAMNACGIVSVMPWTTVLRHASGRLFGMTNIRAPGDPDPGSNVIMQAWSDDHGQTWTESRIVADIPGAKLCEPWVIPSPDNSELACLIRVNNRKYNSMVMFSRDSGENWTRPEELPDVLTGDRHIARYLPDGRLIVAFRDVSRRSPTYGHFCAWIGNWNDLKKRGNGDFRLKLLQHYTVDEYGTPDCGYPGLEVFDDGAVLATTYIRYRPDDTHNSVVCVRFNPLSRNCGEKNAE